VIDDGERISRKRVERLMRLAGLAASPAKQWRGTTIRVPGVRVAEDLLDRKFAAGAPNRVWVADITYLRTWEGWLYLVAGTLIHPGRFEQVGGARNRAHYSRARTWGSREQTTGSSALPSIRPATNLQEAMVACQRVFTAPGGVVKELSSGAFFRSRLRHHVTPGFEAVRAGRPPRRLHTRLSAEEPDDPHHPSVTLLPTVLTLAVASSAEAKTGRLTGTVSPGFTISMSAKSVHRGTYAITIKDRSDIHDFHLTGSGVNKATSVASVKTYTWTVTLKKGTYRFVCDPHRNFMKGTLKVT
jgi:plastocyanin